MCGIVGQALQNGQCNPTILRAMRDSIAHRGPDDAGEWYSPDFKVGLVHRRLAIIDLSQAGHQPMSDESRQCFIVFNGEIYNFRDLRRELEGKGHSFRSSTDTEVVLTAYREWGMDCVQHFNGMFAFGLYDGSRKQLLLARDRAGEKPLFYRLSHGGLTFASELKAFMADPAFPRRLDPEALECFLAFGFVPGANCILREVNKLPPAHAFTFDVNSGRSRVWRYWQLPESPKEEKPPTEDELLEELEQLLEDAVRRQLIADVPIGILLSGGVDSSMTTAMAARSTPHIKTFTIRFSGYGEHDETEHARLIANHFATDHVELEAGASRVELLPLLARQFDEPIVDSSMIPTYMISKLVRKYCTVALGGDGGDELFGGYKHYNRLLWMKEKLGWVPYALRKGCAGIGEAFLPLGFKGRNWLQGLGVDLQTGLPLIAAYFDYGSRHSLFAKDADGIDSAESIRQKRVPRDPDLLQRTTRMDFENYLAEDILVKVDRASMLNSLEVRAPWLDYRIIEFAFGKVPAYMKATSTERKKLPKKLARRLLPADFELHRKQGFSIPLKWWLLEKEWRNYFREVLLESPNSFFDRRFVADLLKGQAKGYSNSERLFALVMFELWRQEYKVTL